MPRRCSEVFIERNEPLRILRRLRAAWDAWKTSAHCPNGEATWSSSDFQASIRDGALQIIEKTGAEREAVLRAGGSRLRITNNSRNRHRPPRRRIHIPLAQLR
jgi:hypothetical protein